MSAPKMLSKEQIKGLVDELPTPYGSVDLLCDGRRITLTVERVKDLKYRVVTYVDGWWKGEWTFVKDGVAAPESKFLRRVERPAYSAAWLRKLEKALGKRRVASDPEYKRKIIHFSPDWASGAAALRHLNKACESVEVMVYQDVLAAQESAKAAEGG